MNELKRSQLLGGRVEVPWDAVAVKDRLGRKKEGKCEKAEGNKG